MTSRELVIGTLNHEPVERAPRDVWPSSGVELSRADELEEIRIRFPSDIVVPEFRYAAGKREAGKPYREGRYTDAWGCTWHASQPGGAGELKDAPLVDLDKLSHYQPPNELLEAGRFAKINRACQTSTRFVLARTEVRPFERLQALHGVQATLVDLTRDPASLGSLLAMIHEFYCREIELWANTEVDGVAVRDAWGSAESLLLPADLWRALFRPLYRDYCKILHAKDKFVFFQSSGNIGEIFGELSKAGFDAIHTEWCHVSLERLARRCRGRVTFWGGIDRPQTLLDGTLDQVRQAVHAVRKALDFGGGGVIAQCPWEAGVPLRHIAAVFEQWLLPLPLHAA